MMGSGQTSRKTKLGRWLFTVAAVGILLTWLSVSSEGRITGSAHDFSSESWNPTGEICAPCHTPHHADLTVTDAPLWNHTVTQATFQLYQSSTFDARDISQPTGRSKLCLSCHDGTVAVDSFGGRIGSHYVRVENTIGTDLRNDHPISFTYDDALAAVDRGLFPPSTKSSGLGGTVQTDMLFSNKLECSSCHDAHNTAGIPKLLLKSNVGSALCLTCHDK
jgi:predicted CXXCH cytochrome family protein